MGRGERDRGEALGSSVALAEQAVAEQAVAEQVDLGPSHSPGHRFAVVGLDRGRAQKNGPPEDERKQGLPGRMTREASTRGGAP
jgi:hypothetical protein